MQMLSKKVKKKKYSILSLWFELFSLAVQFGFSIGILFILSKIGPKNKFNSSNSE